MPLLGPTLPVSFSYFIQPGSSIRIEKVVSSACGHGRVDMGRPDAARPTSELSISKHLDRETYCTAGEIHNQHSRSIPFPSTHTYPLVHM